MKKNVYGLNFGMERMYMVPKTSPISLILFLILLLKSDILTAQGSKTIQDLKNIQTVGVTAFSSSYYQDSTAVNIIYEAIVKALVRTNRFNVIEFKTREITQNEIEQMKGAAFLQQKIITQGKSLGAQVIILGFVKNVGFFKYARTYVARIDYELKFIDVETGVTFATESFQSYSKKNTNLFTGQINHEFFKTKKINKLIHVPLEKLSEDNKRIIINYVIDASEELSYQVNKWIRNIFNYNLLFLKVIKEYKRKGIELVLVEGGTNIGMRKSIKLTLVLVTQMETIHGTIRDEEPIAELKIERIMSQNSLCRIIQGNKKLTSYVKNKESLRILIN